MPDAPSRWKRWQPVLLVLWAAVFFLVPAWYNGYPLVGSDDGTYIHSGFTFSFPDDRPIAYGILIWLFSLNGVTLWGIIVVQALIMALLLWWCCAWMPDPHRGRFYGLLCPVLALTTSLSSVVSVALPDFFCPVLVLAAVLLAGGSPPPGRRILLYGLIFTGTAVHISHLLIGMPVFAGIWLGARGLRGTTGTRRIRMRMLAAAGAALLALPVVLVPVRRSGPAFTVATLLDQGILIPWLRAHCGEKNYSLCADRETMPTDLNSFLWDSKSPLNRDGGFKGTHDAYQELVRDMHRDPAVLRARVRLGVAHGLEQLVRFDMGDGVTPFPKESFLYNIIQESVPGEAAVYDDSRHTSRVNQTHW